MKDVRLILKNPIQRFKYGQIIQKFQNGKYIVKKGDNLTKIAKANNLSLEELLKLNPQIKNQNLINIGQEIKINKTFSKPKSEQLDFSKPQLESKQITAAKEWGQQSKQKIKEVGKVANARNEQLKKAMKKSKDDAKLQDKLWRGGFYGNIPYEKAVDGSFGPKSKAALAAAEQAGYFFKKKDTPVVQKTSETKQPKRNGLASIYEMTHAAQTGGNSLSNTEPVNAKAITWANPIRIVFDPHYSSNIPFLTALQDLTVSTINKGYRKLTGKGPENFLVQNPDIYDIPDDQKQILIKFYQDKKEKTGKEPTSFKASDWRELQGNYTGGNRSLIERAFFPSPQSALEHSLGQWNYYKDAKGNVHAVDTYDWNDGETSANQGSYTRARDFMGKFGTKASETKAQKENGGKYVARTMDINLGKI